ncbi:MAG TPA: hypothetical protein VNS34_00990 [Rhizobiaceae bacterium]|nr:hypothetical protein [Rhizobiaceae bacterium]
MLAFAGLLRCINLGDWNYEVDDQYFSLVGHRMLAGDILYVDIFDRKGPALYLTYMVLAGIWGSVISYQLAGTLCVALAAYGIARIAALLVGAREGLVAGAVYCALVVAYGGANGQTPVFYNPLMVACAWCIITRLDLLRAGKIDSRVMTGFACAGLALALAFKMSAAIEGCYFGLFALALMFRSGVPLRRTLARGVLLCLLGLLPMLGATAWYWAAGYFPEFWQALVTSNFDRTYPPTGERLGRILIFARYMAAPLLLAVWGWCSIKQRNEAGAAATFMLGWLITANLAVLVFPTIYTHYLLPILPPLCICAAGVFRDARKGLPLAVAISAAFIWSSGELNIVHRAESRAESERLVSYLQEETPNHRLLVWGFPSYLYVLVGAKPPSVLAFPPHLFDAPEAGSSGHDEVAEVRKILAQRPEAIVVQEPLPAGPVNLHTTALVDAYLRSCRRMRSFTLLDHSGPQMQRVYSRCSDPKQS